MVRKTFILTSIFNKVTTIRPSYNLLRTMATNKQDDVIFETINNVGVMTLNRPKALNSLNLSMVDKILPTFETINNVGVMTLNRPKALNSLNLSMGRAKKHFVPVEMKEYTMNGLIGTYKIPYVALIDGIVMGGGVGISIHGSYRVCTERTLYAMPETAIGLFPDVGGSYVLPRMQGKLGIFLALTGTRLKGSDVLKAGVATHYIESKDIKNLEQSLLTCKDDKCIKETLDRVCVQNIKEFSLQPYLETINKCFAGNTMEEIMSLLEKDGSDFAKNTIKTLSHMSPTSMKVSLKLLQMGSKKNSLLDCLEVEYRVAVACLANHDFIEGVQALLIRKDKNPKWNPPTLKDVSDSHVDSFFANLPENEELRHKL
ncbi:Enoyl-CoA hydratase/isomerase [Popillia japonica]